jgi:hypothetical protein
MAAGVPAELIYLVDQKFADEHVKRAALRDAPNEHGHAIRFVGQPFVRRLPLAQ